MHLDDFAPLPLRVAVLDEARETTGDTVDRLMGNKPEARFAFIQERAQFADGAEPNIRCGFTRYYMAKTFDASTILQLQQVMFRSIFSLSTTLRISSGVYCLNNWWD